MFNRSRKWILGSLLSVLIAVGIWRAPMIGQIPSVSVNPFRVMDLVVYSSLVMNAGALTPATTSGIIGTTLADNANAGSIGETITATVATGASVSLTTATTANIASISLTAGDWDVWGTVDYTAGATTSITNQRQGISTTSATLGAQDTFSSLSLAAQVPTAAIDSAMVTPIVRINVNAATTAFLVSNATFTVSTLKGYGTITARRRR